MIAVWVAAMIGGFTVMVFASQIAVGSATELVKGSRLPPFFIGMTLLAVGTDLPEIANSIVSSIGDHGDVNVGDSLGSAATQATLILGLLPFFVGSIKIEARTVRLLGWATVAALAVCALVLVDGRIGRIDGAVLLLGWAFGSRRLYLASSENFQLDFPTDAPPRMKPALRTAAALGVVAAAAIVALTGIVRVAETLDVPEFMISFFAASIGTSLPELVFDVTALRRGEAQMAIGDVLGSSFVDATLSIGIGPLLAPTAIDANLAVRGALTGVAALVITTLVLSNAARHSRQTGAVLIMVYAGFYTLFLWP